VLGAVSNVVVIERAAGQADTFRSLIVLQQPLNLSIRAMTKSFLISLFSSLF